jgi:hypothetical protein
MLGPKTDILRAKMNSDEQMCWYYFIFQACFFLLYL